MICIEREVFSFVEIVMAMFVIDIGGVLIEHMVWHFTWFWRISHYHIGWIPIFSIDYV